MILWLYEELISRVTGYTGLFLSCALAGLVLPVPEDFLLVYAGIQVDAGAMTWGPTLAVTVLGVWLRDLLAYGFGSLVGPWVLQIRLIRSIVGERRLRRATHLVEEHGTAAVIIGRAFVGGRTLVFFVAGMSEVRFRTFAVVDAIGTLVSVPLFVWLGWAVGAPAIQAAFWVIRSSRAVLVVAVALLGLWGWRQLRARRAASGRAHGGSGPFERPSGETKG